MATLETTSLNDIETASAADRLVAVLNGFGSAAVALSGGVDSGVVAKAAHLALGSSAVAVTGRSASLAAEELGHARRVAEAIGIRHVVVDTDEFANPSYVANDGSRCYFCKSELYDRLAQLRDNLGFDAICSGANMDDLGDYRPGLTAAAERGVRHPLQEAGFGKSVVRALAKFWNLPNWDKPASPCLSSRIAVGVEATPERTARVEAAERFLRQHGFAEGRVRYHAGDLARIEVPVADLSRFASPELFASIVATFKEIGFKFVTLDLEGFRSGSLNVLVPVEMLKRRTVGSVDESSGNPNATTFASPPIPVPSPLVGEG